MANNYMFLRLLCCIVVAACLNASPAQAKPQSALQKCLDNAASNPEFAECSGKERARKEEALKTAWQCVNSHYPDTASEGYKALLAEEAAWEKFKDSACELYRYDFGREGQVLHYNLCKVSLIDERITYLDNVLYPGTNEKCSSKKP